MTSFSLASIRCVVFDFGFTLSSDLYFKEMPSSYPQWREVIQREVFERREVVEAWMVGKLGLREIAAIVGQCIPLPTEVIVETMKRGCAKLNFNPAVWNFACAQRAQGRKTALVTANMDVFTEVVVPSHKMDEVFDVILNTADYGELRKELLWPKAFERLGEGIGYHNSLLIEDGTHEPKLFREWGGQAYEYVDDTKFEGWLRGVEAGVKV